MDQRYVTTDWKDPQRWEVSQKDMYLTEKTLYTKLVKSWKAGAVHYVREWAVNERQLYWKIPAQKMQESVKSATWKL